MAGFGQGRHLDVQCSIQPRRHVEEPLDETSVCCIFIYYCRIQLTMSGSGRIEFVSRVVVTELSSVV